MLIAFHKPYGVLTQFTPEAGSPHRTLAAFGFPAGVYPLGRLDADSEGLLLRDPPIRVRKNVPDCWIALELTEGRNRQVRRMTAAIGHPTLRLIRVRIGKYALDGLPAGEWRALDDAARRLVLGHSA